MKTIKQLIECGEWEEFFLTESGEKLPKNAENMQKWLTSDKQTFKWSSVSQKVKK